MSTGVLVNADSVLLGGLIGRLVGSKLSEHFKAQPTMVFDMCSTRVGIYFIASMENTPAVIFALVIGTAIGLIVHLGNRINKGAALMQVPISKIFPSEELGMIHDGFVNALAAVIVLFCASGTGICRSLDSGMTEDSTILISRSILDFLTAITFACGLRYVVSVVAVPQFIILYILFLLTKFIYPLTTPDMTLNFKVCGGLLMVATGFRMINVRMFPVADVIPTMIAIVPLSWIWTNQITPLLQ